MFGSSSTSAATHVISVLFSEPKIPQWNKRSATLVGIEVSVLFSEPKIPQSRVLHASAILHSLVSVLFSEPKIPQSPVARRTDSAGVRFSALQRAENSSIQRPTAGTCRPAWVSVLFSEPKIPQCIRGAPGAGDVAVSVLFSEPKIPQ